MAQSIQQVAAGAGEQSKNVINTTDLVNEMVNKVDKTVKGMLRVKEAVFDTAQRVQELGEQSQKISEIIQVIDDIAEQTNLLALNGHLQ